MITHVPIPGPQRRARLRALGMSLGGLVSLSAGAAGIWSYVDHGAIFATSGSRLAGPLGLLMCVALVFAGLAMIGWAIHGYRRRKRQRFMRTRQR